MIEEVGKVIGNKIGQVVEVDKRSWQDDQAKFTWIKVELPIDKPLRRGGHIANVEGGRCWVTFKYERLLTFCFNCGILGHDNRHCHESLEWQQTNLQYGEWLKAESAIKGVLDMMRPSTSKGHESSEDENNRGRELFKMNEDALSSVGQSQKPNEEAHEVTSLNKSKLKTKEDKVCNISNLDSVKDKKAQSKGKLKKIAREMGKAQNQMSLTQTPSVGTKREEIPEDVEDPYERPLKCMCEVHTLNDDQIDKLLAMTAMQHR
nr:hypothetical protein CFP56_14147 [Quercus suber]